MKKFLSLILSLIMVLTCVALPTAAFADDGINEKLEYADGEAIVVLNDNSSAKVLTNSKKYFGSNVKVKSSYTFDSATQVGSMRLATFTSSSLTTAQLVKKLKNNSNVKYAFPNYVKHTTSVTDDTYSDYQWALDNKGQNGGTAGDDTNADSLWQQASTSDKEQIVAVMDTGVDYNNEDLQGSLWVNPYGSKLYGKYGYDFSGENDDKTPLDGNGHGTHCAGIIAAQANNQVGISGINQSNVKIMSLKWIDNDGSGNDDDFFAACDYLQRAMDLGANVVAINNSWGGYGDADEKATYDELFDTFGKKGAVSFVAAGNEAECIEDEAKSFSALFDQPVYMTPVQSDSDYVVVVAATNENDDLANFSSYSSKYVDVAAPGADILSTVASNSYNPTIYDAQKKSTLVKDYQDFENGLVTDDSFGKATLVDYNNGEETYTCTATMGESNVYFGTATSGKSLQVSIPSSGGKMTDDYDTYTVLEIPFTIDNEDENYAYSFMSSSSGNMEAAVYDVPADNTTAQTCELEAVSGGYAYSDQGRCWDHVTYNVDVEKDVEEYEYVKSTERKLVIIIESVGDCTYNIDDLSISKSNVDFNDFGKYEFYNGTSMATPYAAGAYALIKNVYPNASTTELINILENTGRYSSSLEGKTQNAKVLSLDKTTEVPPMITGVAYNADGNVSITGALNNPTSVSVNGADVEPISATDSEIIIADNDYSTKNNSVTVSNEYGSDTLQFLICNADKIKLSEDFDTVTEFESLVVPAGDYTYLLNSDGSIDYVTAIDSYDDDEYLNAKLKGDVDPDFDEDDEDSPVEVGNAEYTINLNGIVPSTFNTGFVTYDSATYLNNKIYFTAYAAYTASSGETIGMDTMLGAYNLITQKTEYYCELPNGYVQGSTLATYNGNIYLIGGYDTNEGKYLSTAYKYNADKAEFEKLDAQLPTATAYGKAVQYKDTLVYAYGATESGKMPAITLFDGNKFTTSSVTLESDDYYYADEDNTIKNYSGQISLGENGVFFAGAFIYDVGDMFTYDVDNDSVQSYDYCYKTNSSDTDNIFAFAIPQGLVAYGVCGEDEDEGTSILGGAYIPFDDTTYAYLEFDYADGVELEYSNLPDDVFYRGYYNYGDIANVTLVPTTGYALAGCEVNDNEYNINADGSATDISFVVDKQIMEIIPYTEYVAPAKVSSIKVSASTATTYTLTWSAVGGADGYQVQEYVNGAWQQVALTSSTTKSYKITSATAGTHKYRVRAYKNYTADTSVKAKKYYGTASSTLSVYVAAKQKISSVTAAKKAFTVKYTKNTSATGYYVQYSTSSKFTSTKTVNITKNTTTSKTVSGLKAKTTYYVRVRSYKTINGVKVYGAWSAVSKVKTK